MPGYRRGMDEAEAVLERLARIEALDRAGAPARSLIDELRALVTEAERWSRVEGGEASEEAVTQLESALAADEATAKAPAGMIAV
jgi:hypothetical protein